jgi:DNA-binding NtrC family response regulator
MDQDSSGPLVYVIDGEIPVADSLATMFCENGLHATPFTDPRQALFQARRNPPQLVLVNSTMTDLAVALSGVAPGCRFLFLSESSQAQTLLERARRLGFCCQPLVRSGQIGPVG